MRSSLPVALVVLVALSCGCGTIEGVSETWPEAEFYCGVRADCETFSRGGLHRTIALDMPFSLVADTVMLPVHLALYTREKSLDPPHAATRFEDRDRERREPPEHIDPNALLKEGPEHD